MNALVNGAKLTAFVILENDLRSSQTVDDFGFDQLTSDDNEKLTQIAAASVNYWFGEVPNGIHKDLDLKYIHAASTRWLSRNDSVRELVIQAMRVLSTIRYTKLELVAMNTLYVLEDFGKGYPDAPDTQTFEAQLRSEMLKLSPDQQNEVRRIIEA